MFGAKSITQVVRIEKFVCSEENIIAMSKGNYGIRGLLGADSENRINYYLNETENKKLFLNGYLYDNSSNIMIYATDLRLEKIDDVVEFLSQHSDDKQLVIFTHEWAINSEVLSKIEEVCNWAKENNYKYCID